MKARFIKPTPTQSCVQQGMMKPSAGVSTQFIVWFDLQNTNLFSPLRLVDWFSYYSWGLCPNRTPLQGQFRGHRFYREHDWVRFGFESRHCTCYSIKSRKSVHLTPMWLKPDREFGGQNEPKSALQFSTSRWDRCGLEQSVCFVFSGAAKPTAHTPLFSTSWVWESNRNWRPQVRPRPSKLPGVRPRRSAAHTHRSIDGVGRLTSSIREVIGRWVWVAVETALATWSHTHEIVSDRPRVGVGSTPDQGVRTDVEPPPLAARSAGAGSRVTP